MFIVLLFIVLSFLSLIKITMKDKIYYFQEKSNDILDLQDELTIEEIGMYFILKAAYFKNFGELTENNLVQRCRFFGDKEKLIQLARKLFEFKEGCLINNSWLSQIKGIKEKSDRRKEAANARWQKEQEESKTEAKPKQKESKTEGNVNVNVECKLESQFEEFWNLYNYKKGKPKALAAYKICIKKTTHQQLLQGVKKYNSNKGTESKYWKHPATWLNAESWNDEYSTETNRDICKEINQIIGEDWIIKIEAVEERAILSITQTNWQKMKGLSDEIKKKIAQKLNQELKTTEIKQKYID